LANTNSLTNVSSKPIEVSVRVRDEKKPIEKVSAPIMLLIGFGAVFFIGYEILPQWLYESVKQPMQFNHAIHMGEKGGMSCEDCHGFRDDGSFVGIPPTASCADCHEEVMGDSPAEKQLVEQYIKPGKEIPWLVYSRQPDNTYFSHIAHVKSAEIKCSECHGNHEKTDKVRIYERNVITGYSRDIWGSQIGGFKTNSWDRMKMDDCADCHIKHGTVDNCMTCHK
jgi:hypothetical protein